jgi:hypothetical protein
MSRQRDMRVVRPSLITRQNTAMLKLVELHKLLDSWQGITHSETLARLDDHTMTVHQTSTPATRELDTTNPRVRATLRNIERYEHRLSDTAVSMALALELAPPAQIAPDYVALLTPVFDHAPKLSALTDKYVWPQVTDEQPPGQLCHLANACTFSDTDPPHLPMPKPKQIILGHGVGSLWPHT